MRSASYRVAKASIAVLSIFTLSAYACPDDQYEQCVLGACVCLPKVGGAVGAAGEKIKKETNREIGGRALQIWFEGSHSTARGTSKPVPPHIRKALRGYVPDAVMDRASYKVGDNGVLNLAGLTQDYGDKLFGTENAAVVLIDVIVFRNSALANDLPLWAHELKHVQQFMEMGTSDFAKRYAANYHDIEDPAYDFGNNYINWKNSQNPPPPTVGAISNNPLPTGSFIPPPPQMPKFISGTVMLNCGCWGFSAPSVAPEPRCQSGAVVAQFCGAPCSAGGQAYGYLCQ